MVYSTALLERSWLEYERNKTTERAVLQIQALVDQHTQRLAWRQDAKTEAMKDAPAQQRLRYTSGLAFPPRWGLQHDLAMRYHKLGVIRSALEIFYELHMWGDAVEAHLMIDEPHKAEEIIKTQLRSKGATPQMMVALGDLCELRAPTDSELKAGQKTEFSFDARVGYYAKAWELSGRKYARAKRMLGRVWWERSKKATSAEEQRRWMTTALSHYKEATNLTPMHKDSWFLQGVVAMRVEDNECALTSFRQVHW